MHTFYGTRLSENMAKTPEGYLICYDVNIARIGKQDYLGNELSPELACDEIIPVDRPASEVFKPATIASFEGKPFTNDHPFELLDVSNTAIYEKGHVQNVRASKDKTYIMADIIVKDTQTIRDIENGKRELSAGYYCDCVQDENGSWYQCNIIGNHVALVDKGRAGEKVRINDAFNEAEHPRKENGEFAKSESSSSDEKKELTGEKVFNSEKTGMSRYDDVLKDPYYAETKQLFPKVVKMSPDEYIQMCSEGFNKNYRKYGNEEFVKSKEQLENSRKDEALETLKDKIKEGKNIDMPMIEFTTREDGDIEMGSQEGLHRAIASKELGIKEIPVGIFSGKRYGENIDNDTLKKNLEEITKKYVKDNNIFDDAILISKKKENKPMKDKQNVLGKLLKAFAKDAEPDEILEAVNAVKGEDADPAEGGDDRIAKLEAQVAELIAKLEKLYVAEKQEEQGEMHALDELEQEITDGCTDGEEKVMDEDAENDPKLIEAQGEKAQEDEDATEEIKKEIADAKKVIAKIEDKETRLAVADSLATIIRGKMKSSENYKKLMDASKNKIVSDSKATNYSEVFKKIKENNFRK